MTIERGPRGDTEPSALWIPIAQRDPDTSEEMRSIHNYSDRKQREAGLISGLEEVSDWETIWRPLSRKKQPWRTGRSLEGSKHIVMQEMDLPGRW